MNCENTKILIAILEAAPQARNGKGLTLVHIFCSVPVHESTT